MILIAAFCKEKVLEVLDKKIISENVDKRLLVRFQYQDIVSGATDFSLYPYCRDNGWELYFLPDLHAKVYLFDGRNCIMGSANMTQKGLGIIENCNEELATEYVMEESGRKNVEDIFRMAVKMTDAIYEKMERCLERDSEAFLGGKWDKSITELFVKEVDTIFMSEFPQKKYTLILNKDDYSFLSWNTPINESNIKDAFRESKAHRWLETQFKKTEKKEIYFGELTAALHRDIINEPMPYRKDVKELLANLLQWTEQLDRDNFLIDVPKHSTRVRYIR